MSALMRIHRMVREQRSRPMGEILAAACRAEGVDYPPPRIEQALLRLAFRFACDPDFMTTKTVNEPLRGPAGPSQWVRAKGGSDA